MKYGFRLLIAMILISLSSFSQTGTKIVSVSNNDSVKLHKDAAKLVVKDLMHLDVLRKERVLLLENIDTLGAMLKYKDSIIVKKNSQIKKYENIIEIQEEKSRYYVNAIKGLESEVKRQKFTKRISQIAILAAVGFIILK